ncbi:MAG: hypothetical protein E7337_16120 [Clostridiales bacterium]|nr:hypothetical protein [Clostridiales bacterium]
MALTMVHLLVAERWAQAHPELHDCPEFYLGAISPDALHVRFKDDKSRKNEFHLNNWITPHPDDVAAYWQDHRTPFDIGYGVHVLTDGQWVPRYKQCFPELLLPNGLVDTATYYNDTFVTDFALYNRLPWSKTGFEMLKKAVPPTDHPLLTYEEFDIWRSDMIKTYAGECPMNKPVQYINEDYVLVFSEDSIHMIEETYRRVFA